MALPEFTMHQLLEAGCHFGHQSHRWNPKMAPYIFGVRNKIHIMDLSQTVPLLHQALRVVSDVVADGGRVLFVATKRQASEIVADAARRSAQYYVNARWLGGMLTNWNTVSNSIRRLRRLEEILSGNEALQLTKKERLSLARERDKLERALGGIKDMGGTPDLLFIIDTNRESIAIQEAKRLNVPVVAILDSNSDPGRVTYPVPGNDDASRSISLYCNLVADAALDGIARQQSSMGADPGETEDPVEVMPEVSSTSEEEKSDPSVNESLSTSKSTSKNDFPQSAVTSGGDVPLPASSDGEADDLKKITGVGPVLEKKLNALGITKFIQIVNFTDEKIEEIDKGLNFKGRIERDGWIAQARELVGK